MRQDPDESGIVPDDHLLVRPYVAPSGPPPRSTAPAWPQAGPLAFPGPAHVQESEVPVAVPAAVLVPVPGSAPRPAVVRGRRSRLPFAVLTLLSLAAVGALVLLLSGPDAQPPRAGAPAELSVPMLRGRSSNSGAEAGVPGPTASAPAPAASTSPTPSRAPTASASQGSKPPSSAGPSASGPPSSSGTLRMGDTGPEVRALQELLYAQGFTYVSVNGVYDSQTKRGVGQLQRDRSIKGDSPGVYGPATQAAMR
ncbi:peptidoglycan-binding domain-containing protein [Streptomyces virginiae]|uniref:peptidoglycan-binding domain-containing protein n=1 Tax=Streptomyces virginiae TaxID=1961 RepID=UPI002258FB44|nr:peptidoglycan-binding domain-containing protein [Streptomyces virginiae]MCX5181125.1 peptidoglycan-binding protein [Streptomyces virginiae]